MKPFLHGKKSLAIPGLRLPAALTASHSRPHAAFGSAEDGSGATIEVVKEGDKIARLVVTCACGEKIEIDCIYPAGM